MWYNIKVAARKPETSILKIEQCTTSEKALEIPKRFGILRSQKRRKNHKGNCERIVIARIDIKARSVCIYNLNKEFDPGSGRTLAARLTHASRTENIEACFDILSGGRVSNTWVTCLWEWDSFWKRMVIPHNIMDSHVSMIKDLSLRDGLASD